MDAQALARLARIDPQLLSPIQHRSAQAQADLSVIRARYALVRKDCAGRHVPEFSQKLGTVPVKTGFPLRGFALVGFS
jgi:hypothetical protein